MIKLQKYHRQICKFIHKRTTEDEFNYWAWERTPMPCWKPSNIQYIEGICLAIFPAKIFYYIYWLIFDRCHRCGNNLREWGNHKDYEQLCEECGEILCQDGE